MLIIVALYFGIVCLLSFDLGWFVRLWLFLDKVWFRVLVLIILLVLIIWSWLGLTFCSYVCLLF